MAMAFRTRLRLEEEELLRLNDSNHWQVESRKDGRNVAAMVGIGLEESSQKWLYSTLFDVGDFFECIQIGWWGDEHPAQKQELFDLWTNGSMEWARHRCIV